MSRPISSLLALCAGFLAVTPALAADYDTWNDDAAPSMRNSYPTEPGDWSGLGDKDDPVTFESGVRYWYSMGSQSFSTSSGLLTESDTAHIGELHLRIEDHSTNVWAEAIGGYSVKMDGSFSGPVDSGPIVDGHVAYIGGDIGWNTFGDNDGSGVGIFGGYQYTQEEPDTGRVNFTTATSAASITYDTATGQTFLPGDSAPNHVATNEVRLGISGKAKLSNFFDISGQVAAIPFAKIGGTVGVDDPTFNSSVYGGPAQVPYGGNVGNISSMRSSATDIDGWGYGASAEAWVGIHPTDNMAFRLGGRVRYLQGTVDETFSRATIGNPTDADLNGVYDTPPSFVNTNLISTSNPFSMMRYGLLAELSYTF